MNERGLVITEGEAVFTGAGGVQFYCRSGLTVEPDLKGRCHNETLLLLRDGTLVASYFLTRRLQEEVLEGRAFPNPFPAPQ